MIKFTIKFKKFITLCLMIAIVLSNIKITAKALTSPPTPRADSAVLIDAATGEILYEKNKDSAYPPASTTKIMTALLTLENCDLNEYAVVSKKAERTGGSRVFLYEGEKLKVEQLLDALMIASANDAAVVLAEHIAGSVEDFAKLMNKRAKELGCRNTTFANPHGLYNKNHKTSAYDLVLIMRELVKYPTLREICKLTGMTMQPTNKTKERRPITSHNYLMIPWDSRYYEYAEAGKTGYTIDSLHSYVASAKKGNQRLIAAFVHDNEKRYFRDSIDLFNYGFENFQIVKQYSKGEQILSYKIDENTTIPLLAGEDFYYVKRKDLQESPLPTIENVDLSNNTYNVGDYVIDCQISYDNKNRNLKLLSGIDYKPDNSAIKQVFSSEKTVENSPINSKKPFIYTIILIIIAIVLVRLAQVKRKRKRRKKSSYSNDF